MSFLKDSISKFQSLNKRIKIFIGLFLVIVLVFSYRSCSRSMITSQVFRIARPSDWNFLQLTGKERNLQAFTDELLFKIAQAQNLKIEIFSTAESLLMRGLDSELYDGVITTLTPNVISEQHYIFSNPLYSYGQVLIVRRNSEITSLDQLAKKPVGIKRGVFASQIPGVYATILTPYDNVGNALSDLERDRIDGVLLDAWSAYVYTQGYYQDRIHVITNPLTNEALRLVVRNEFIPQEWMEAFNHQLTVFQQDGTYAQLLDKWGIYNTLKNITPVTEIQ